MIPAVILAIAVGLASSFLLTKLMHRGRLWLSLLALPCIGLVGMVLVPNFLLTGKEAVIYEQIWLIGTFGVFFANAIIHSRRPKSTDSLGSMIVDMVNETAAEAVECLHRSPNEMHQDDRTFGQRAADACSAFCGSWMFIFLYIAFTVVWCVGNIFTWSFDPYPYQFYTFSVSVLAILMSALLLLAGNRQAEIDRAHAENAYRHVDEVNAKQDQQLLILQGQNEVLVHQNEVLRHQTDLAIVQHATTLATVTRMEARQVRMETLLRQALGLSDDTTLEVEQPLHALEPVHELSAQRTVEAAAQAASSSAPGS